MQPILLWYEAPLRSNFVNWSSAPRRMQLTGPMSSLQIAPKVLRKVGCMQFLWAWAKKYHFSFFLCSVPLSFYLSTCFSPARDTGWVQISVLSPLASGLDSNQNFLPCLVLRCASISIAKLFPHFLTQSLGKFTPSAYVPSLLQHGPVRIFRCIFLSCHVLSI